MHTHDMQAATHTPAPCVMNYLLDGVSLSIYTLTPALAVVPKGLEEYARLPPSIIRAVRIVD